MSPHVVTRGYRPPEVALGEDYDQAIDIWSLGCVFYELMVSSYFNKHQKLLDDNIFESDSNLPLSPVYENADMSENDLVIKQIQRLSLKKVDMKFIKDPDTADAVQIFNESLNKNPLKFDELS